MVLKLPRDDAHALSVIAQGDARNNESRSQFLSEHDLVVVIQSPELLFEVERPSKCISGPIPLPVGSVRDLHFRVQTIMKKHAVPTDPDPSGARLIGATAESLIICFHRGFAGEANEEIAVLFLERHAVHFEFDPKNRRHFGGDGDPEQCGMEQVVVFGAAHCSTAELPIGPELQTVARSIGIECQFQTGRVPERVQIAVFRPRLSSIDAVLQSDDDEVVLLRTINLGDRRIAITKSKHLLRRQVHFKDVQELTLNSTMDIALRELARKR